MKKIFVVLVVLGVAIGGCEKANYRPPDHVTLTWADDPHTTQTVSWRTDTTELNGAVRYTAIENLASFVSTAVEAPEDKSSELETDKGTWRIHTVTVRDLTPGKTYCYVVGYGSGWSGKSTFTTESENTRSFKFLIMGDSQSGEPDNPDYSEFQKTLGNAYQINPDAKFFINMGDLVEIGGYYVHWSHWFDAAKDVINKIPAMPIQGNHETYKDSAEKEMMKPIYFTSQFKVPQNGPDGFKGQVYSYNYGEVHFAVLDSQIQEENKFDSAMEKKEADWLDNDLKNTNQKWKVVLLHKTPYYNKRERTNDKLRALFQPIIDKYHVDFVLNGHDHGVSRTYPIKDDKFVSQPSQGTVYCITGRSGKKKYTKDPALKEGEKDTKGLLPKVWNAFFYDPQDQPNYVVAEVNDNQFTITAYKQDGNLIDQYMIDKSKDEDTPTTKIPAQFKDTRLVVYGELLPESDKPVQIDGQWYVPADSLKQNFGITYKEDELRRALRQLGGKEYISADDLKIKFGFTCKYYDSINMLMFTKEP